MLYVCYYSWVCSLDSVLKKYPTKFIGCCLANPADDGSGLKQFEHLVLKVWWFIFIYHIICSTSVLIENVSNVRYVSEFDTETKLIHIVTFTQLCSVSVSCSCLQQCFIDHMNQSSSLERDWFFSFYLN